MASERIGGWLDDIRRRDARWTPPARQCFNTLISAACLIGVGLGPTLHDELAPRHRYTFSACVQYTGVLHCRQLSSLKQLETWIVQRDAYAEEVNGLHCCACRHTCGLSCVISRIRTASTGVKRSFAVIQAHRAGAVAVLTSLLKRSGAQRQTWCTAESGCLHSRSSVVSCSRTCQFKLLLRPADDEQVQTSAARVIAACGGPAAMPAQVQRSLLPKSMHLQFSTTSFVAGSAPVEKHVIGKTCCHAFGFAACGTLPNVIVASSCPSVQSPA